MTHNDQTSYLAADGREYLGSPPPGWRPDDAGRWWAPTQRPVRVHPIERPRRWWHNKLSVAGIGLLVGVVIGAVVTRGSANDEAAAADGVPAAILVEANTGDHVRTRQATMSSPVAASVGARAAAPGSRGPLSNSEIDEATSIGASLSSFGPGGPDRPGLP